MSSAMSDTLTPAILHAVERALQSVRQDLYAKGFALRCRAEVTLVAVISGAVRGAVGAAETDDAGQSSTLV